MLNSIPTFPFFDRPEYSLCCARSIPLLNVTVVEFHTDSEPDELPKLFLFSFHEGIFSNMWKEALLLLQKNTA